MRTWLRAIALSLVLLGVPISASLGQAPFGAFTAVTNGTISVTNTFQSILSRNDGRRGCTIQNQGTHTMYVYFGAIANATLALALQVSAGQTINCGSWGIILQDQISITGTSGDAYVVNAQ